MIPGMKSIEFRELKTCRKIRIRMKSGRTIVGEAYGDSWIQSGGRDDEMYHTVALMEKYNDWLHGGPMP